MGCKRFGTNFSAFTVGIVAFCLYMPDQVISVGSKHLSKVLNLQGEMTRFYLAKYYSNRNIVAFLGSFLTLLLQRAGSHNVDRYISFVALYLLVFLRYLVMFMLFCSSKPAVYFYYSMLFSSFFLGVFQMVFYPLAAEEMSLLSVVFRASKLFVWLFQLLMDTIFSSPNTMILLHLLLVTTSTLVSSIFWTIHLYSCTTTENGEKKEKEEEEINATCNISISEVKKHDDSVFLHFKKSISPVLMCLFGWSVRSHFIPGIIPYTLVERNLCHAINLVISPVSVLATVIIHVLKKYLKVESLSRKWKAYEWDLIWLFLMPQLFIIVSTYRALHNPNGLKEDFLYNNVSYVMGLCAVLCFCTVIMESVGYVGVAGHVREIDGKYGENASLFISINAFISQISSSISYRLSCGYLLARDEHMNTMPEWLPTNGLNNFQALCFWIRVTLIRAYHDFLGEFKGNIEDYCKS